jgi:hypothetical protein
VKYLGRSPETPPGGWRLVEFADDWVGADNGSDGHGPRIFKPATIQLDTALELAEARASERHFAQDPDGERLLVGGFWDVWHLRDDGTFSRRSPKGKKTDD